MNKRKLWKVLRKQFALFAIYLIISLIFFTAKGMAELSYNISGDAGAEGFARKTGDIASLVVTADSNVSFVTGIGTENYKEIPLQCSGTSTAKSCLARLTDLASVNVKDMSFTLKQESGVPATKTGVLHIDSMAPISNKDVTQMVIKTGSGLTFSYDFKDYLASNTETTICEGSGIASIEFNVNGKQYLLNNFTERTCNASGQYFVNMSNFNINYGSTIDYYVIVTDRAGNKFSTDVMNISGDFKPPKVDKTFKILSDGTELTTFSSASPVLTDIVVKVEDSSLNVSGVFADLSMLNSNPRYSSDPTAYKNAQAVCVLDVGSRTVYTCTFGSVYMQPGKGELAILVSATDMDGNNALEASKATVVLKNSAGTVLYLGPDKSHCTTDLSQCYLRNGTQVVYAEIDATSNYSRSIINLGINGERRFAVCRFNSTWKCTGVYNIVDISSFDILISESYDNYGNSLESGVQRTVTVDTVSPVNTTSIASENNNKNVGCSVSGDQLTLKVKVQEATPDLKIYLDTSLFTSKAVQTGKCEQTGSDWECTIIIKDFVSYIVSPLVQDVIVEDLAGNKLQLPFTFEVCKAISTGTPNVIFGAYQQTPYPYIDKKIASMISVQVFIPLQFHVPIESDKIMYLTIDRCVANDAKGMNIIGSDSYFIPSSGTNVTLALKIGRKDAMIADGDLTINCTVSARIRSGSTIFIASEKETIPLIVTTFEQPLGTLDEATTTIIKDQKAELRAIDKRISGYKKVLDILEWICKISDIMVKINGILQTLKAVIDAVCIILDNIFYTKTTASRLWKKVNELTSKFDDKIIQHYIWPTGKCKDQGKCTIGWIMKYTCILYTCKFYTLSGLIEIGSDAATKWKDIQDKNDKKWKEPLGEPINGVQKGTLKDGTQVEVKTEKSADGKTTTVTTTETKGTDKVTTTVTNGKVSSKETVSNGKTTTTNYNTDGTIDNVKEVEQTTIPNPAYSESEKNLFESENGPGTYDVPATIPGPKKTTSAEYDANGVVKVKEQQDDGTEIVYNYATITNSPSTSRAGFKIPILNLQVGGGQSQQAPLIPEPWTTQQVTDANGNIVQEITTNTYTGRTIVHEPVSISVDKKGVIHETGTWYVDNPGAREPGTFLSTANDYTLASEERQRILYSDIDRSDWIINPYKSQYYDDLCAPAVVYNLQKERQIRCMYVDCLLKSQVNGLPTTVCNQLYAMNNCLYLESAQRVLYPNVFGQILAGLVKQAIQYVMGWAVQEVYTQTCDGYQARTKDTEPLMGWKPVLCGLFSAGLKWQEISKLIQSPGEVMKDLFKGGRPADPGSLHDYCDEGRLYAYDEE